MTENLKPDQIEISYKELAKSFETKLKNKPQNPEDMYKEALTFFKSFCAQFETVEDLLKQPKDVLLSMHAVWLFCASNAVYFAIESGKFKEKLLKGEFIDVVKKIHAYYFPPDSPFINALSAFDPTNSDIDITNLSRQLIKKVDPFTGISKFEWIERYPDYSDIRRTNLNNMIRAARISGKENTDFFLVGYPEDTLQLIIEWLGDRKELDRISETLKRLIGNSEDVYLYSFIAATVIDCMHIFGDGNGRTSEDFMVALQSALLGADKVKRYSFSGLRSKGLEQENVGAEYLKTQELLGKRKWLTLIVTRVLLTSFEKRPITSNSEMAIIDPSKVLTLLETDTEYSLPPESINRIKAFFSQLEIKSYNDSIDITTIIPVSISLWGSN